VVPVGVAGAQDRLDGVQITYIHDPKTAYISPGDPKTRFLLTVFELTVTRILNRLLRWHSGPEKAGVGGSIPSLATTFSITYSHREYLVCSILFQ